MQLRFHGAADGVTGSLHRLTVGEEDLILDCGLFQGRRQESNMRNRDLPRWTSDAGAVVLSHAHLDHSGSLPTLAKRGFEGNIFCTPPTRDLCSVMLRDAAMLQEQDARYLNKRFERQGLKERIEPLYSIKDAQAAMGGPGSIRRWKRAGRARGDFVHLTRDGYGALADALFSALMTAYDVHSVSVRADGATD